MPSEGLRYVSASDLADYAYCPRSHWYRHHPPERGPTPDAVRSARAGTRTHHRQLRGERRRSEWRVAYWLLVVAGLLIVLGGSAWLL
ncbi:MAG: CRISPR-associated protein Cas4 [Thermoplasmata archaeon]|nr:CRISPR-associated protein Cas4 [Thermoplasmata archaeon]